MKFLGILFISILVISGIFVFAQEGEWGDFGNDPLEILDNIVDKANDEYDIQDSPLERVNERQGGFPMQYRLVNTLDSIRTNIAIYIQWIVFIGLTVATIGLIYIGFLMVTNSVGNAGTIDKVKVRVTGVAIGVVLITGFYAVISLFTAIITALFGNSSGGSGF